MINKDFIAGIAVGALHAPACNLNKVDSESYWHKDVDDDGIWYLTINYKCAFYLSILDKAKEMVSSFCECTNVIVGYGSVQFVIKEEGEG